MTIELVAMAEFGEVSIIRDEAGRLWRRSRYLPEEPVQISSIEAAQAIDAYGYRLIGETFESWADLSARIEQLVPKVQILADDFPVSPTLARALLPKMREQAGVRAIMPAEQRVLTRLLQDQRIKGDLRDELQQLLDKASGEPDNVVRGPAAWFTGRVVHSVQLPQGHAAADDRLPLLMSVRDDDIGVSVQARGRANKAWVRVAGDTGRGERLVAVKIPGAEGIVFVAPLSAPNLAATFVWPMSDGEIQVGSAEDLMSILDQPEVVDIVRRSVGAADGATQEAWKALAVKAGPDSRLYAAVAEGLR